MKLKLMAAAALVAMGGAAQAQFLTNGGFEDPVVPNTPPHYQTFAAGAVFGGWTAIGCSGGGCAADAVSLVNNAITLAGYVADTGAQWLDLTGGANLGFSGAQQAMAGLTPGQLYTLSFALGATSFHNAVVDVTIGSGAAVQFSTLASSGPGAFQNVWQSYSIDFIAGTATDTLQFMAVAAGAPVSVGIDSISVVTAVPEPSAYALALAGLGALGFLARRRKSRA